MPTVSTGLTAPYSNNDLTNGVYFCPPSDCPAGSLACAQVRTSCPSCQTPQIVEADICMVDTVNWRYGALNTHWTVYGTNQIPFRSTLLHELGHAFGLAHNWDLSTATMNSGTPNGGGFGGSGVYWDVDAQETIRRGLFIPHGDDRQGYASLYGYVAHYGKDLAVSPRVWKNSSPSEAAYLWRYYKDQCIRPGEYATFPFSWANYSDATVSAAQVKLYLATSDSIPTNSTILGVRNVGPVYPNTNNQLPTFPTAQIPYNTPPGMYFLGVGIQAVPALTELHSSNNTVQVQWRDGVEIKPDCPVD